MHSTMRRWLMAKLLVAGLALTAGQVFAQQPMPGVMPTPATQPLPAAPQQYIMVPVPVSALTAANPGVVVPVQAPMTAPMAPMPVSVQPHCPTCVQEPAPTGFSKLKRWFSPAPAYQPIGCSNCKAEKAFLFGSCNTFHNEGYLAPMPPPAPPRVQYMPGVPVTQHTPTTNIVPVAASEPAKPKADPRMGQPLSVPYGSYVR
jgi:hypothetical protein